MLHGHASSSSAFSGYGVQIVIVSAATKSVTSCFIADSGLLQMLEDTLCI
jgi:hypothetical protein